MAINNKNEDLMTHLLEENILPGQEDVQLAFELYRRKELKIEFVDDLCNSICERIKQMSSKIYSVSTSYTTAEPNRIVFVVKADGDVHIDTNYSLKICHPGGYSEEGTKVTFHEVRQQKPITPEESEDIAAAIQKNSKQLFDKHSNIQIIAGCSVKSRGFGTEQFEIVKQTCVVIYVNAKGFIPLHEELLPEFLSFSDIDTRLPVDVREGGMQFFGSPKEYHQNVKMGCEITDGRGSGTLGAVFEKDGKTYGLTCAHVFSENEMFRRILKTCGSYSDEFYRCQGVDTIRVYQGGVVIGSITNATITSGSNQEAGIDIAVIEFTDESRLPNEGSFPDGNMEHAGFSIDKPMLFKSGKVYDQKSFREHTQKHKEVVKYGKETEYTRGMFDVEGTCVKREHLHGQLQRLGCVLNNQLVVLPVGDPHVNPFATVGDSGSLLLMKHEGEWNDLRAVGIIEGGTTNYMTIVTPIWDVFKHLHRGTEEGLKQFTEPRFLRVDSGYVSNNAISPTSWEESNPIADRTPKAPSEMYVKKKDLEDTEKRINTELEKHTKLVKDLQTQTEHFQKDISDKFQMLMTMMEKNMQKKEQQ